MRKMVLRTAAAAAVLTAAMGFTAFAGQWEQNETGWWWQNDDGSYPASCWQWLDGNQDGQAECYYFDANGYMLADTTTPDGYEVDANGAWIENGQVKTQSAGTASGQENQGQTASYADDYSGSYRIPYYESETSMVWHTITLTYDPAANTIHYVDPVSGYDAVYTYFGTGLNGWTSFELVSPDEKDAIFFSAPGVLQAYDWGGFLPVTRD